MDLKVLYDKEHFLVYQMGIQPISYERWTPFDTNIKIAMYKKDKEDEFLRIRAQQEKSAKTF
jgi:hypothetical protein